MVIKECQVPRMLVLAHLLICEMTPPVCCLGHLHPHLNPALEHVLPNRGLRHGPLYVSISNSLWCPSVSCHSSAANIDMAVKACREENNQVLHNRSQMQMVKEATNEGYCDISGRAGSLTLLGVTRSC